MKKYSDFYVQHGFALIQRAMGRKTLDIFHDSQQFERQDNEVIRQIQLARLVTLHKCAKTRIPFYKSNYANGPKEISSFQEFATLPILDRSNVISNHTSMVAEEARHRKLKVSRTGGSSGAPLTFFSSPDAAELGLAMMMRGRSWWGVDYRERSAVFIEHGLKFEGDFKAMADRAVHSLRERVVNRRFYSAYRMGPSDLTNNYHDLKAFKPAYLIGYASFLYLFAKHLIEHHLPSEQIGVRCIFYTSEMLYPWQKELIEKVFRCPVVGEYGCKEVGVIAYQCRQGNWHTMDDSVYVEVVPLAAMPGYGDVVVTQLRNHYAPFIRYRTGDIAELLDHDVSCPCGLGLSVMAGVEGRSHDWIMTPNGGVVHGQVFCHALIMKEGERQFRVHQKKSFEIEIELVVDSLYSDANEHRIKEQLKGVLGESVPIEICVVDRIEPGSSGKFRWISSDISVYERPSSRDN
jgi:phenylacetate-CoA ligase